MPSWRVMPGQCQACCGERASSFSYKRSTNNTRVVKRGVTHAHTHTFESFLTVVETTQLFSRRTFVRSRRSKSTLLISLLRTLCGVKDRSAHLKPLSGIVGLESSFVSALACLFMRGFGTFPIDRCVPSSSTESEHCSTGVVCT